MARVSATDEGRAAIETILDRAHVDVTALLAANRWVVVALRDALLERDELVGQEIVDVILAANPPVDLRERRESDV